MKIFSRIIAAALAVCMVLPFTACSGDTTWVYDYDGEKISAGLYIAFTMSAYTQVSSQEEYDSEKDFFDQTIEEKTTEQWIIDKAQEMADEYVATNRKFDELGLTLTEEEQAEIDNSVESVWSYYGTMYEDNGVAKTTYAKLVETQQKRQKIFMKYYGEGGLEEVPVDQLETHFKENFASVNIFSITLNSGDDLTDEQKEQNEEREAKAQEYVDLINSGEKTFNEVRDMATHLLADTEHDDEGADDVIENDDETKTYVHIDSTSPSEKLVQSIFNDVKVDGEAKLLKEDNTYYIVKRYDVMEDEKNFEEMRETILGDVKSDDFVKEVESWTSQLTRVTNDAAVKRYSPRNINLG